MDEPDEVGEKLFFKDVWLVLYLIFISANWMFWFETV